MGVSNKVYSIFLFIYTNFKKIKTRIEVYPVTASVASCERDLKRPSSFKCKNKSSRNKEATLNFLKNVFMLVKKVFVFM